MKNKLYFLIILCLYNTIITAQTVSTLTPISVSFHTPQAITLDALGNMYVADTNNNKIRKISQTLATTDFEMFSKLKIYPNPVKTILNIQTPNNNSIDKIYIVDLLGKKVLEQTQNTNQINVEHLAKGIYIIETFLGQEKFSSKFVKD